MSWASSKTTTPTRIKPDEDLARFIFHSNGFNSSRVKQAAFLPAKNLETSVFRKTKLVEKSKYEIKKKIISSERGVDIKAVATIKENDVELAEGLTTRAEESKHKWHANIIGWPQEKHEQKQLAQILAHHSSLET